MKCVAVFSIATALALGLAAAPVLSQPLNEKLKPPEPDKIPVLRIAPGYSYMAGSPAAQSVEATAGSFVWLTYFPGQPGNYVGDPNGAPVGKKEIFVQSAKDPSFINIIAMVPMTPDAKGNIKVKIGSSQPLHLAAEVGVTHTYFVRVRNNAGYSNVVSVAVSAQPRPQPLVK